MYKNYIFDLYGTLVDIHTDEDNMNLWKKLSVFYSFNEAHYLSQELKEKYLEYVNCEKSKIVNTIYKDFPIENVFKRLYENKNVNPSEELIKCTAHFFRITSMEYEKLYDGAVELLQKLKEKNKKVYLLSNAQRIFTCYEIKYLGIEKYFDDIFISSDYYVCKPDKKFYETLLKKYNIDVQKSIMIGNDLISDIMGASKVGLKTLYIKSNQSPKVMEKIKADYSVLDGDVRKIADMIIK